MNNLELYDKFRKVPETAKKNISGGRLKGMTDINPMWRIKTLTEEFGICGFGWYYEITDKWIETSMAKDEITANVKINLYVKRDNEWSKPIVGIGGSMLVANERNGLYVNDECYKMALTDAISVACKSLGIGADVYWNKDNTKYNDGKKNQAVAPKEKALTYREKLIIYAKEAGIPFAELAKDYDLNSKTTEERFKEVLEDLEGK
nr:MAG TPA: DNA REPAIR PROTEIN RAD52 HOMOLOG-BINDING PROTEIN, DNA REPAIR, DNA.7A [Caudoviricetes sp.]